MRTAKIALFATIALVVAACGSDAGGTTTTVEPTSSSTAAPATTTTSTTATAPSTTTTAPSTTSSTLAGSPIDFGPAKGDILMVIGVAHDDVLNLRAGPGTNAEILDGIPPTYDELVAVGNTRKLSRSFWIEVEYEASRGWVSLSFVGYAGQVDDRTAEVVAELDGYPTNDSMTGLAEEVTEVFAIEEEGASEVVQVTPVTSGDLTEVTYDVIGLADDAVRGLRLHIFAEESDDGFALSNVEVRVICGRGVDGDLCV